MGFFDAALDVVGEFYPYVKMGADIYGAVSSAKANKKATGIAQAGVAEGNRLTQEQLAYIMAQTEPAIQQQRQVVAQDPYTLTPEQQREMDDIRQSARRTLTGGPFAGSGRAQVRMFNEMEGAARDRMTTSNARRADEAAGRLSSIGFGAHKDSGTAGAGAAIDTALLGADKVLANQRLTGQAIGDVMSYVNDWTKAKTTGVKQTVATEPV